ncbi:CapA family protein [Sphingobium sp. HBC34]|uniref:CapA family protein n=1 Tax=Sphingobium cyanobacteriorum TaxID=3063954 RepID=A0ABT8ZM24_9SPHN|nr:CapA family protein [Sphingobium sp. HBC34]MDO7835594.1 CapA family protein [Sphingobium sp. HBC34]
MIRTVLATLALLASSTALASATPAVTPTRTAMTGDFTLLVGGDLLGPYDTSIDPVPPRFQPVADLIRKADVSFANQEGNSFDLSSFTGSIAAENGGGYPIHTPATMRGLRAIGINLLSRANNHSLDWGEAGLLASDVALDAIGFMHAGTGRSLTEAREPAVIDTGRGRVALIATASTFPGISPAGNAARGAGPRPGMNPLHVEPVHLVNGKEMEALVSITRRGGWQGYDLPDADRPAKEVHLAGTLYRASDTPGLHYDVSAADRRALLESVASAATGSDLVLFSIHAHETLSGAYEDPAPADFLPPLFHDAIDKGAALVVRHGPHATQGIEIYKGKPIFYGTGHFFFELPRTLTIAGDGPNRQTVTFPDSWWESTLATVHYHDGKLVRIRIYPIAIIDADGPEKGVPTLARGAQAKAILERVAERSKAFGTRMRIEGETAVIDHF